jgi:hypothetical protein
VEGAIGRQPWEATPDTGFFEHTLLLAQELPFSMRMVIIAITMELQRWETMAAHNWLHRESAAAGANVTCASRASPTLPLGLPLFFNRQAIRKPPWLQHWHELLA